MSKKLGYKVHFGADTKAYRREVKKAQGYSKKFGSQVKTLGPMIATAFSVGAVTRFFKTSLEGYDKQAKAEAGLLVALKGREDIMGRIIRQAQDLQRTTLFGDEETIQAGNRLAQIIGVNEEAITRLIPLVQDLAQAKFRGDLETAADLVAKSVGSSTNALSRYGIQIEGTVGSVERLESAVAALNDQVGGQAVAAANAGMGAVKQWKNAWGDLKEEFGEKFAPMLTDLASWGTDQMQKDRPMGMKNIIAFGWKGAKQLKAIKEAEGYATNLFSGLTAGVSDYDVAVENVSGAIDTFNGKLKVVKQNASENEDQIIRLRSVIDQLTESLQKYKAENKPITKGASTPQAPGFQPFGRDTSERFLDAYFPINQDPFALSNLADSFDEFNPAEQMAGKLADMRHIMERNRQLSVQLWQDQFLDMNRIAEQGVENMAINAFASLGDLMNGDVGMQGFFDSILRSVGEFSQMMGSFLVSYGMGMEAFQQTFKNPYAAIAVGGSLIALGTAIANAASSPPDIMSGQSGAYSGNTASQGGYASTRDAAFNANLSLGGKIIGEGKSLKIVLDNVNNELEFTT